MDDLKSYGGFYFSTVWTICVIQGWLTAIVKFNGRKIGLETGGSSDCGLMASMRFFFLFTFRVSPNGTSHLHL